MERKDGSKFFNKYNIKWVLTITIWTFILAIIFSILSENLVKNLNLLFAFFTLNIIIIIGIIFDIIGIAITRAEEKPFHSMASKRIKEARIAIYLIRNAGPVSNFCNDVVGDISGIISGAIGANLIYKLIRIYNFKNSTLLSILITASTAALTVGGKALGKSIALIHYETIIIKLSQFINLIENTFKINLVKNKKNKK
ncbi:MAG TPA: hypothetical protein VK087_00375 [Tissierellaceae bacterium]|nr:hypothetical protein [Tissierellaceae bacterium]